MMKKILQYDDGKIFFFTRETQSHHNFFLAPYDMLHTMQGWHTIRAIHYFLTPTFLCQQKRRQQLKRL